MEWTRTRVRERREQRRLPVDDEDEDPAAMKTADVDVTDDTERKGTTGTTANTSAPPAGDVEADENYGTVTAASFMALASALPQNKIRAQMRRDDDYGGGRGGGGVVGRVSTGAVELVAVCSALLLRDLTHRASDLAAADASSTSDADADAAASAGDSGGNGGGPTTTVVVRAEHVRDAILLASGASSSAQVKTSGEGVGQKDDTDAREVPSSQYGFLADAVRGMTDSSFPVRSGSAEKKRRPSTTKSAGRRVKKMGGGATAAVGEGEEGSLVAAAALAAESSSSGFGTSASSWQPEEDVIVEDEDDYD